MTTVAARELRASWRGVARVATHPILVESLIVLAGFGVLAVAITWPLAADFSTRITGGGGGGDAAGYVWDFWNSADSGLRLFGLAVYDNLSAPFGREYPGAVNATLLVNMGPGWFVSEIANPIAAFNTVVLSAIAFSGAAMYLLVRWLGAGRGPAAVAGISLAMAPFLMNRVSAGHAVLTHLECFPLLVMAGVYWAERPSVRRAALLGLAWLFCWLSNPYFGVAGGLVFGCFALWVACSALRRRDPRGALVGLGQAAGAGVLLVAVPIYALYIGSRGEVELLFTRQKFELLLYGARLDDYVRPPGNSVAWDQVGNPFAYVAGGERVAYPGGLLIVLALVGIAAAFLARRTGVSPRMRIAALITLLIVPVIVICSLASPQRFLGVDLHLPSELIFEVVPFIRAFARLSAASVAVLGAAAAVGLWFLLRKRPPVLRAGVCLALMAFVALETPGPLPLPTGEPIYVGPYSAKEVPTWAWLKERKTDEIVFEMPGQPNEPLERLFMIGQTVHGHPMVNGSLVLGSLGQDFQKLVADPSMPHRPEWLAATGVDLLTVSPWAYGMVGLPALDPEKPLPGFTMVKSFGADGAIWRVSAAPADAVPIFRTKGWWLPESLPDGRIWRWMDDEGHITVFAREAGVHRVALHVVGWGDASRTLEITGPDRFRTRVGSGPQDRAVSFDMPLRAGRNDMVISNLGRPAEQISDVDIRIVSVRISEPEIRRVGPTPG